jgi:hypothetical protein
MSSNDVDVFMSRKEIRVAVGLSFPTISREQRADRFPKFEPMSIGRRGLRRSVLDQYLSGQRDWRDWNAQIDARTVEAA